MIINDPFGWETGNVSQPQLGTCSLPAPAIHTRLAMVLALMLPPSCPGLLRSSCSSASASLYFSGVKTKRD